MLFQNLYKDILVHQKLKTKQGNPLINSVRTRFVTNLTVLGSHVKRPKQCHLQSVGLKGQALVTRWWVCHGVHTRLSYLHPWSLSPGGGLGGSGFWPFFPARSIDYSLFLLYQPVSTVLRPRVELNLPRLILVPSVHTQSRWGWL